MDERTTRNAQKDLALCNAATEGPWKWNDFRHSSALERDAPLLPGNKRTVIFHNAQWGVYQQDREFIAESREALPYWIKRAEALEKALQEALDTLCGSACDKCPGSCITRSERRDMIEEALSNDSN